MAQDAAATDGQARRRGRWWRGLSLVLALPVVFALALPVLMLGQEVTAPSWITRRIEAQAATLLRGGRLDFGSITLTVGADLHPVVRLADSVLTDASGATLLRLPEVRITLSPRGLLFRREALPQQIVLRGPELALLRRRDGALALRFEAGAAAAEGVELGPAALDALLERPPLEAIEEIRAEGVVVNYQDLRAGRTWTLDDGRLELERRRGALSLRATASVLSGPEPTQLALSLTRPPGREDALARVSITGASARDIATQSPGLAWLSLLDAPLSVESRVRIAADGTLGQATAELGIGPGALRPRPSAAPLEFREVRARLTFEPDQGRVAFDEVSARADSGSFGARGQVLLGAAGPGGLPQTLVGQFALSDLTLDPPGLWPAPLRLPSAMADIRLSLDPFRAEVGSLVLEAEDGVRLHGAGEVRASDAGWQIDGEAQLAEIGVARLLALWPERLRPGTRDWFATNLTAGRLTDVALALRLRQGAPPVFWASQEFRGATLRLLPTLPPIEAGRGRLTVQGPRIAVALDAGTMRPDAGGPVDAAGTSLVIEDAGESPARARVELVTDSTITAALALLDLPPFGYTAKAGLAPSVASGRAAVAGTLRFPLARPMPDGAVAVDVAARLSDVASDALVPGRDLAAETLTLALDNDGLSVAGPLRIGEVPLEASWSRRLGPESAGSARLEADVTLSPAFLREFDIALPDGSVDGAGQGRLTLDFPRDGPPAFALTSDLGGLTLQIPALGWSKSSGATGRLEVAGVLGDAPRVDRLALSAPGLDAAGSVALRPGGGLEALRLSRLRVGDWLDVAATLRGTGAGRVPEIDISGGTLDLRRAAFGSGGAGGGPLSVALDRLQVTDEIALTGLEGRFDTAGGLSGSFAAALNGGTGVRGSVAPRSGGTAVELQADDAGAALRDAGLLPNASGGALQLSLQPTGRPGSYDGRLGIGGGLRVQEAPELARLLDAVSVVGLLQQLDGQGLAFDSVEARFRLDPGLVTVISGSAVGPGLGLSLDGYFATATRLMDFQGVISPIYFLNGIGQILTRRGEGLVGFNFTLKGPAGDPEVAVNPLSLFTPGMFREIFRRPPPEVAR